MVESVAVCGKNRLQTDPLDSDVPLPVLRTVGAPRVTLSGVAGDGLPRALSEGLADRAAVPATPFSRAEERLSRAVMRCSRNVSLQWLGTVSSMLLGLLCGMSACDAAADVIRLKSGGELRGRVLKSAGSKPPASSASARSGPANRGDDPPKTGPEPRAGGTGPLPSATVSIELLSGVVVTVDRASIELIAQRPLVQEEYEVRARQAANTLESQWELAEWCRQKSLTTQRVPHLERVLEFDPDHEKAHLALGHIWKDGAWVDQDAYMAARGFVKHKGRYITTQELELIEKSSEELQREQDWFPKVRLWSGWATGSHPERASQGFAALRGITEADAAPAVMRFLGEHPHPEARGLAVAILRQSPGEKAAVALARQVLRESDGSLRAAAIEGIDKAYATKVQAIFIKELRNESNAVVCRAALGLAQVGDDAAVGPLIDALTTSHRYYVRMPGSGQQSYSFTTNGGFAGGGALPLDVEAALRTGQLPQGALVLNSPNPGENVNNRVVLVRQDHQNGEVLKTLQRLTGENLGYDERLWHLWWAAKRQDGGLAKS